MRAEEFLAQRRIAVTGVSRSPKDHGANVVYKRLRDRDYDVFAVNPNADDVEGDRALPDLASIPGEVDGVVIGTARSGRSPTVRECIDLGISRVWFHRGPAGQRRTGRPPSRTRCRDDRHRRRLPVHVRADGRRRTQDHGPMLKLTGNVPRRV